MPEGSEEKIDSSKVSDITEEVAYWRKANQIHKWFVDNVQSGNDDCGNYEVSRKQLSELLGTVNRVLEVSKLVKGKIKNGQKMEDGKWVDVLEDGEYIKDPSIAQELLPNSSGFFFGSTEYDEYYIADLKYTKEVLEKVLNETSRGDFYYHSSW